MFASDGGLMSNRVLGLAVVVGLAGSLAIALVVDVNGKVVLGTTEMARVLLAAALFVAYLFAVTAVVRAFSNGDLPIGFSVSGAQYGDVAKVSAAVERQVLELNARLDDQTQLLEAAIDQMDARLRDVETRLP